MKKPSKTRVKQPSLWQRLGPGLIMGAAYDDPSGIATYSQALMAARQDVMGQLVVTRRLKVLGWLATGVMALAVLAMFATWGTGT